MRALKWSKKYEVFVPELDAEHRNVFRITEELHTSVAARGAGEHVHTLLNELLADLEEHFRHEEQLMRAARYPSFEWHKRQHETVRNRVKAFVRQNGSVEPEALTELLGFLSGWLRDHTSLTDRMMCSYVRNYRRANPAEAS